MGRKCYISFKTEDEGYKKIIQEDLEIDMIDKSLNDAIQSDDEDYIMRKIREDYLNDSTVTLFLIGKYSSEDMGLEEQRFIKRELQASLYKGGENKKRNGILGVVLPSMTDKIYMGKEACNNCGNSHNIVAINNSTTIREFNYNYYIPNEKCAHSEEDRYCVLIGWDDFKNNPNKYIEKAFEKRESSISDKVKVYPK